MASNSSSSSGGIGFVGLLTIVFIVLKLGVGDTGVVEWSWWWVLSPLWIAFIVFGGLAAVVWWKLIR